MPIAGGAEQWTDAFLDQARLLGDAPADAAVRRVVESGSLGRVNRLLRTLVENDQPPPGDLPAPVAEYLATTAVLPSWADANTILAGQQVFVRHGPLCLAALACGSLPLCYAQRSEARVLGTTQKLVQHEQRRILETAQFVIDVMQPGGLSPRGRGVRTVQKVRLMHAAIRNLLRTPPPVDAPAVATSLEQVLLATPWEVADGAPISQEDLAFTLQTFGVSILGSLDRFGVELTVGEREAYLHAWSVAGSLLGVSEDLLPSNETEARTLFAKIQRRRQGASEEGRALTRAVERFIEGALRDRGVGGSIIAPRLTRMTIRELIPEHTAYLLDVQPLQWWESLTSYWIFRAIDRFVDHADALTDQKPNCTASSAAPWASSSCGGFRDAARLAARSLPDTR
ncbi:MAG: oxygenase MpaB family protein [Bryobacterales bacterium]